MPTTRPRHQITETEEVSRAIDNAARRWPGESRSKLILRLVDVGNLAIQQERDGTRFQAAVRASSGKYGDVFDPDYLTKLREDWPE